jgi:AraC-like DNA-binding protein
MNSGMSAGTIPVSRVRVETSEPLESRELLDQLYGVGLKLARADDRSCQIVLDSIQAGSINLTDVDIPFDGTYDVRGEGLYVFATLLNGTASHRQRQITYSFSRGDTFIAKEAEGEACARAQFIRTIAVTFPAGLLAELARQDPDQAAPRLEFTSREPVPGGARRWRQAVRFVQGMLVDCDETAPALIIGPANRLLAAVALSAFPNSALAAAVEQPCRDGRDAHPDTLRRAIAYIDANPDLDITITDIARAAYATPRAVQMAFRRDLDTTPMAYLRRVRLQHAHQQLQHADGQDGQTVTRVALDWGFASASRFAAYYRAAYGRAPSETLTS